MKKGKKEELLIKDKERRKVLLDAIRDFDSLFLEMGLPKAREASTYYVLYISEVPEKLTDLGNIANDLLKHPEETPAVKDDESEGEEEPKKKEGISPNRLETGRKTLVEYGLMARVWSHSGNKNLIGVTEMCLPVNPIIVWKECEKIIESKFRSSTFNDIKESVEKLSNDYLPNFCKYGIRIEEGKLIINYSLSWLMRTLFELSRRKDRDFFMWLSGISTFRNPSLEYIDKILGNGSKIKMVLDRKENIDKANELKQRHKDRIKIRYLSKKSLGTDRKFIVGDELAIDGIKILPPDTQEPSYFGIIYLRENEQKTSIYRLKENFDSIWNLGVETI